MLLIVCLFTMFGVTIAHFMVFNAFMRKLQRDAVSYWEVIGSPSSEDARDTMAVYKILYKRETTEVCVETGNGILLRWLRWLTPLVPITNVLGMLYLKRLL